MQLFDDDLEPVAVRKTPLSAPFIYKSLFEGPQSFYQERLGTNIRKALKKRVAFFAGCSIQIRMRSQAEQCNAAALPRQRARDATGSWYALWFEEHDAPRHAARGGRGPLPGDVLRGLALQLLGLLMWVLLI
jgi:hypothetical protein